MYIMHTYMYSIHRYKHIYTYLYVFSVYVYYIIFTNMCIYIFIYNHNHILYIYTQYIGFCWENPALMENAGVFVIFKAEEWLFRLQLGLS